VTDVTRISSVPIECDGVLILHMHPDIYRCSSIIKGIHGYLLLGVNISEGWPISIAVETISDYLQTAIGSYRLSLNRLPL
jgi:hypothetical protein